MFNKLFLLFSLCLYSFAVIAQVPVRKEPRHKNVFENKYIRLLDVHIPPGDTTMFHIHSTPSVFVYFTNTLVCSQIKDADWQTAKNIKGNASYRSFVNDTLVHRVSNCDSFPFHVTDVELLLPYNPTKRKNPLPLPLLFENERVFAYQLTDTSLKEIQIKNRGPLIAEVVTGEVKYSDIVNRKSTVIKAGKFLYIEPGKNFTLKARGQEKIILILFEIK